MARDYARDRGKAARKRPSRRRQAARPGTPGWVWMLLGIAIGIVAAAAFWILRPAENTLRGERVMPEPPAAQHDSDGGVALPPEKPARFSFYEMLPSYEVLIPRDEVAPEVESQRQPQTAAPPPPDTRESRPESTPALAEEGDYVIQIGSFRSREDADGQRAQLALIGVEARIETVTINGNQTWYRVRVGPIASAARVHSLMVRLQEHGLSDVMLMRVKG